METPLIPLYTTDELKKIRENFMKELTEASQGTTNSLAFLKNTLPLHEMVKDGEVYQAITIGGTVCKNALCKRNGKSAEIIELRQTNLPLITTRGIFLELMRQQIDQHVNVIGLSFAFPLNPIVRQERLDGILLKSTKEHTCEGLIGKTIGEEVEQDMRTTLQRNIKITVANDTVCLVLSGLIQAESSVIVGGIVGTGTNMGIFLDEKTVINLESGNFSDLKQTATGILIDKDSASPGSHMFEKEVSGAYLYKHYNLVVQQNHLPFPLLNSSEDLFNVAADAPQESMTIARALFKRSAGLVAAQISGMYDYKKQPKLTFIMEGTLFWSGYEYKQLVEEYLREFGIGGDAISFVKINNSDIIGSSQLPLI